MAIGTVVFVFAYGVSLIVQRLTRRETVFNIDEEGKTMDEEIR